MFSTIQGLMKKARLDLELLIAVYLMSVFGIFCISMATYDIALSADASPINKILNSRSSMWQSIFLLVSPFIIAIIYNIPTELIRRFTPLVYTVILIILLVTLVMGEVSNGLRGWMKSNILGRSIQPCEFSKLSVLLMLSSHFANNEKPMSTVKDFFITGCIIAIPCLIVLLQGETGSVIVIGVMSLIMMIFAGVDWRITLSIVLLLAAGIVAIVVIGQMADTVDYRILRLLAFLDPEQYADSGGYQILNSQAAIGAGRLTGSGVYQSGSWATLGYVPESSTDSIFSVIGECFGFVGCAIVLLVFLFMLLNMLLLAKYTTDRFSRLIIIGVMSMLGFHVFQNVAMSIGYMPITGIPLPFLSYGGSNFITCITAIALVLNVVHMRSESSTVKLPLPKPQRRTFKKFVYDLLHVSAGAHESNVKPVDKWTTVAANAFKKFLNRFGGRKNDR